MKKTPRFLSLDAFSLRLSLIGFGAITAAVLILGVMVTPAHRGGGPVLEHYVRPFLEKVGLWHETRSLKGSNPLAEVKDKRVENIRFLIRFENEPGAEAALRKFRENKRAGRDAFRIWAASSSGFQGFELATLTPAGEAVIVFPGAEEEITTSRELSLLGQRLAQFPGVVYVDPYPFLPDQIG